MGKKWAGSRISQRYLGKEREFSGKFLPTLEIILVFNETVENAQK